MLQTGEVQARPAAQTAGSLPADTSAVMADVIPATQDVKKLMSRFHPKHVKLTLEIRL